MKSTLPNGLYIELYITHENPPGWNPKEKYYLTRDKETGEIYYAYIPYRYTEAKLKIPALNLIVKAQAKCHKLDSFNKKIGRIIALDNLLDEIEFSDKYQELNSYLRKKDRRVLYQLILPNCRHYPKQNKRRKGK